MSEGSHVLKYVPDRYVKLQEMWYEDFYNDDGFLESCNYYKQRITHKTQIEEDLIPVVENPTWIQDPCMAEDEKRRIKEILT